MKPTLIFILILSISMPSLSADKVTCFKYKKRKGEISEKQKKRCRGKWKATKAELHTIIEIAHTKCLEKAAKGKPFAWTEVEGGLVTENSIKQGYCKKDRKLLNAIKAKAKKLKSKIKGAYGKLKSKVKYKRCLKSFGKLKDEKVKGQPILQYYNDNQDHVAEDYGDAEAYCKNSNKDEMKFAKRLSKCVKKLARANRKGKITKQNGDQYSITDVFQKVSKNQYKERCDKRKFKKFFSGNALVKGASVMAFGIPGLLIGTPTCGKILKKIQKRAKVDDITKVEPLYEEVLKRSELTREFLASKNIETITFDENICNNKSKARINQIKAVSKCIKRSNKYLVINKRKKFKCVSEARKKRLISKDKLLIESSEKTESEQSMVSSYDQSSPTSAYKDNEDENGFYCDGGITDQSGKTIEGFTTRMKNKSDLNSRVFNTCKKTKQDASIDCSGGSETFACKCICQSATTEKEIEILHQLDSKSDQEFKKEKLIIKAKIETGNSGKPDVKLDETSADFKEAEKFCKESTESEKISYSCKASPDGKDAVCSEFKCEKEPKVETPEEICEKLKLTELDYVGVSAGDNTGVFKNNAATLKNCNSNKAGTSKCKCITAKLIICNPSTKKVYKKKQTYVFQTKRRAEEEMVDNFYKTRKGQIKKPGYTIKLDSGTDEITDYKCGFFN